ncbi:helix-turn-helix domain-containing protein [Pseudactinotalea sp. Z1732]|uniref:helix-turn-helix domain-containing protein n=1 Tax=Micrococcales TaxID=85006 RepID=UPI003C7AD34C
MSKRLINGPAVRAIRELLGVKHGVFAIDCDITPGYLTNIEKGRKQPAPHVQVAIAKRLGQPLDAITYVVTNQDAA